jgi:hypothetical protein
MSFKFNTSGLMKDIEKKAKATLKEKVKRKVESILCPIHKKTATVVFPADDLKTFEVKGCCEEVIERIKKELKN